MNVKSIILAFVLGLAQNAMAAPPVDYAREVKPILAARCTSCHGAIRQKAGLRLDTADFVRRGGKRGPAVEPGKSGASLLIDRVTGAGGSDRMPPESEGVSLSDREVAMLRAWIDQGAKAPPEPTPEDPRKHWAYQPPARPTVPRPADLAWARNPIDAFLAERCESRGLRPSPSVAKDLWLRRVYLDLIGLPPTREERHVFLADGSADAEERIVDRLLADPRHGERWGRHWMDVWRYSDWYGLGDEVRYSHPHIWQWRDWIVASVNADKGYDRMIIEMLAGDELAPDDPATLRATGFLVRNWDIFNRNAWLASTVEHTARAFLGVTIQCARCHDHKFDPISQADYYRLRAFFEPYHIRIDRVPGQPDRTKAGLPRTFDDFLESPTYLFIRGDEAAPDKTRPMSPATPAVLGGEVKIVPVSLSLTAACPDKRAFVAREAVEAMENLVAKARAVADAVRNRADDADKALAAATAADRRADAKVRAAAGMREVLKPAQTAAAMAVEALAKAERAARDAREDRDVAKSSLALAEAKRSALMAVLHAEGLEDQGAKTSDSSAWSRAAREALAAQRQLAYSEASFSRLAALRDLNRARRHLDGLLAASSGQKGDPLKDKRARVAAALVEARGRLAAADRQSATAAAAAKAPLTTGYTPRALEFPRAKTTYRDNPSNAPYSKVSTGRRLALARWIVDRRNPLTARVAVNHVWARHFGEPLVGSVYDLGLRTPQPEHHKLLDWLAVEFMESAWSFKHLHRLILTSRAYRMRSSGDGKSAANVRIDPDNHYFWRMNIRRMEGEVVRDCVLFLAGRLDTQFGGPDRLVASAESGTRRTIYYRYASGDRIPLLDMFDAANVTECYRRHETIVPQQALALTNSGMVLTRAKDIASTIDREVGGGVSARGAFVVSVFERVLGRAPTEAERTECAAGLAQLAEAFAPESKNVASPEARARSALVHVLLNHNDFVSIR
ncbi:MAG: PSD1 and planctomycete cytochrome C domain-containing protein [Isosphaeraceae bacterium]